MTIIETRKAALMSRVKERGGPLNEPAVLAQFLAQVMHESGGLRYVREIWGPTKAQKGYEGRKDLGNTHPGDGKRFMGRDVIQVTGRANYQALSKWAGVDFVSDPEALERPAWLGIGAIWYFLTRDGLIDYARAGNIEMVTRRVNGGLNGYQDRLRWYDRIALEMLKAPDVRTFQAQAGLVVDGISGPKTRAAMHEALSHVKETPVSVTRPAPHVKKTAGERLIAAAKEAKAIAEAQNSPAQRASEAKPSQAAKGDPRAVGRILGAVVALLALTSEKGLQFLHWLASFF